MPVEMTGKMDPGFNTNSTTDRVYNSMKVSRTSEMAKAAGPVGGASQPGSELLIVKGGVRGILKQMNVGDVGSAVDSVDNALQKAVSATKEQTSAQVKQAAEQSKSMGKKLRAQASTSGGSLAVTA